MVEGFTCQIKTLDFITVVKGSNEEFERILCQSLGEGRHSRGAAALLPGRNYMDIK